jgi:hypothetical protein
MESLLLRLSWILIFLQVIFAVPTTMNAIRDEVRLDDGMCRLNFHFQGRHD